MRTPFTAGPAGRVYLVFAILFFLALSIPMTGHASEPQLSVGSGPAVPPEETSSIDTVRNLLESGELGGHIKLQGALSFPGNDSIYRPVGTDPLLDGNIETRLKYSFYPGTRMQFEVHYEVLAAGGDSRRKTQRLAADFPGTFPVDLFSNSAIDDERRFFDLTKTICEKDSSIMTHRLDRLSLSLMPEWGLIRIGRQAVTWGNGMIFNPMDLFNPFAPTDILREYKVGDDMVFSQFSLMNIPDVQVLCVPRRNPATGDLERDQSSFAGKVHFSLDTTEIDILFAEHYDDIIFGLGSAGYIGNAAWRMDGTWTRLSDRTRRNGYPSLVANLDYSWVWFEKNIYGFLELYFNGLGKDRRYEDILTDPDVLSRLRRGELYTVGRIHAAGHVRVEVHPLINIHVTMIDNIHDHSGVMQPRIVFDVSESIRLTAGGNHYFGAAGTEFGGFALGDSGLFNRTPSDIFIWGTFYF